MADEAYATKWQERWLDRFYRRRPGWTDGTTDFHRLLGATIRTGSRILEVGAGPTNRTSAFLATLGELYGVDVDAEALANAHLREARVIERGRIPYPDGSFDAAVSNYVVEHVADPVEHLSEIHRVLRPGARYLFRTPNLWHYVALFSWLTPHSVHRLTANRLRDTQGQHEPWPTVYAMNTPKTVREFAAQTGFAVRQIEMVEKEPSYGMYARPLFVAFMAYERVVNASAQLERLRSNMFVVLDKT